MRKKTTPPPTTPPKNDTEEVSTREEDDDGGIATAAPAARVLGIVDVTPPKINPLARVDGETPVAADRDVRKGAKGPVDVSKSAWDANEVARLDVYRESSAVNWEAPSTWDAVDGNAVMVTSTRRAGPAKSGVELGEGARGVGEGPLPCNLLRSTDRGGPERELQSKAEFPGAEEPIAIVVEVA